MKKKLKEYNSVIILRKDSITPPAPLNIKPDNPIISHVHQGLVEMQGIRCWG